MNLYDLEPEHLPGVWLDVPAEALCAGHGGSDYLAYALIDSVVDHGFPILDAIGDLYLLGYPVRGKVTASLTGHRDNIEIQRQILAANS